MNNKSNRKLLAALAVMAVAFVALAAIPAVDAEDATGGETAGGTTVVAAVAKIGEKEYESVTSAINDATDGQTVVLLNDVTESITISKEKNVVLDLAGFKLTNQAGEDSIFVVLGGTLTVKDSSTGKTGVVDNISHGRAAIFNNGTVILEAGKYIRSMETGKNSGISGGNSYYNILNHGTMTVGEGVAVEQTGAFSSLFSNGYFTYSSTDPRMGHVDGINAKNPSLTINGGTFSGGLNTIKNDDGAVLTITGGTFTNVAQDAVMNNNIATITGGKFYSNTYAVENCNYSSEYNAGSLTITGGQFDGKVTDIRNSITGDSGEITIAGVDVTMFSNAKVDLTIGSGAFVTINGNSIFGDSEVKAGATLAIEKGVTLSVSQNASLDAASGAVVVNNGKIEGKQVYAEGAKVQTGGNTYTIYRYESEDVSIQYGVSCGDVYYTGNKITKYDVILKTRSFSSEYQLINQGFDLLDSKDGEWTSIVDAGTYSDALMIQMTFRVSDDESITVNLKTDLIVKPLPLYIEFEAPKKLGDIDASEFQSDISFTDNVIAGKIGYYNLNGMDGYYLVVSAKVVDGNDNVIPGATIKSPFSYDEKNGVYVLYLGKDADNARETLENGTVFSADKGRNYTSPEYKFTFDVEIVEPMTIGLIDGDVDIWGAKVNELHGTDLTIEDSKDATVFDVSGTLLWKAGYIKFNETDSNEQRGWYLAVKFSSVSGYDWSLCEADLKVLKDKHVEAGKVDGEFIFRVVDVDAHPEIVLKDVNGFRTKYVLNIDDVEFGTASGYGETKNEAEEAMETLGIDVTKLTENGSDVVDKTMFMIFNTSAFKGNELTATAVSTNDENASYTEKFVFDGNIGIWYFSFDDQAKKMGVPGPYDLEVKSGTTTVAEGAAVMKGVYVYSYGFRADATEAYNEIKKLRSDIPQDDVAPNTFWMIVGIYGYADGTEVAASMVGATGEILTGNKDADGNLTNAIVLPHKDGEAHKWAFYFSFDNNEQVKKLDNIYGKYTMSLKAGDETLVSEEILVATSSSMVFAVADEVDGQEKDDFGADLKVETDGTKVTLNGTMKYIRSEGYFFPISMSIAAGYPGAKLTVDGEAAEFGAMLLPISADKKTFDVVVDLDGDGDIYSSTTYTLTFIGKFEDASYGVLLHDLFYGEDPILFETVAVGKSFILPNGPDASKDFIGWQIEGDNGKVYSAGAFVIMTEGMDANGNGDVVFTAVYLGSHQRDSYEMKVAPSEDGKKITISTTSKQIEDYRNLSANHYYIVTMKDASGNIVLDRLIASPTIISGKNVYSETFDVDLPQEFGIGCVVSVQFKTDYAMGKLQICNPVVIENYLASESGYKTDATEALEAINTALKTQGRDDGVEQTDVDSNTAYTVFTTTDDLNGKKLTAYVYSGDKCIYGESMTFSTAGPHAFFFSFNDNAPSHVEDNGVVVPMENGTVASGDYVVYILDEKGNCLVKSTFSA